VTAPAPEWRSWHLHVASRRPQVLDDVVTTVLPAALERASRSPDASTPPRPWFFIRYWQGGPHIRLRIADLDDHQATDIEAVLAERLDRVNAAIPPEDQLTEEAYRRSAAPIAALGEHGAALPLGRLMEARPHRAVYEPEYERYGGRELMQYSEDLFHASSVVCLRSCAARPAAAHAFLDGLELLAAALTAWPDQTDLLRSQQAGWRDFLSTGSGGPVLDWTEIDRAIRADAVRLAAAAPGLRRLAAAEPSRWSAWTKRLRAATDGWRTALGPDRARQILGSHLHMAHNRLGLSPLREAQLSALLLELDVPGPRSLTTAPRTTAVPARRAAEEEQRGTTDDS
jgi:thiopeptide-type bacteriocin biosynthesis protein